MPRSETENTLSTKAAYVSHSSLSGPESKPARFAMFLSLASILYPLSPTSLAILTSFPAT